MTLLEIPILPNDLSQITDEIHYNEFKESAI